MLDKTFVPRDESMCYTVKHGVAKHHIQRRKPFSLKPVSSMLATADCGNANINSLMLSQENRYTC
jgi:hypothetical protein